MNFLLCLLEQLEFAASSEYENWINFPKYMACLNKEPFI